MEWLIGAIAVVGMAVFGLVIWDRLGRLQFEIERLKTIVAEGRPAETAMAAAVPVRETASRSAEPISPAPDAAAKAAPAPSPTKTAAPAEAPATVAAARTGPGDTPSDTGRPAAAPRKPAAPGRPAAARWNIEQLFGARLAVWGGGAALAMAGFFLVMYSIEIGLVTPAVRMVLGGLFGLALLAAAELVHRRPRIANGARIAQALAGAGIADLYAMLYIAASVYGLIGPAVGFAGMAAVTAVALLLSLRRGAPIAVMGLIGGFVTPALVSAEAPNVPVLMLYLILVIGGLMLLIKRQGWWWLAIPAALGGFGWVGLILASDVAADNSVWLGLFLLALAVMVFLTSGERQPMPLRQALRGARTLMPILTGGVALAQLALVVGIGDFGWTDWGLFGLLAAACVMLGARNPNCALLPPIALAVMWTLLALWPGPEPLRFAVVAAGSLALFGGAGYGMSWAGRRPFLWLGQAVAASLGLYGIAYLRLRVEALQPPGDTGWALLALALAVPAVISCGIFLRRRRAPGDSADHLLLIAGATVAALVATALMLTVPAARLPFAFALQTLAVAAIARHQRTAILNWVAGVVAALFAAAFLAVPGLPYIDALARLSMPDLPTAGPLSPAETLRLLVLPALAMAAAAGVSAWRTHRLGFSWTAMGLATLALAALAPLSMLPLLVAAEALVLLLASRRLRGYGLAGQSLAALGIVAVQALPILNEILAATLPSLAGWPVEAGDLPALGRAVPMLGLPAVPVAAMAWLWPKAEPRRWRMTLAAIAAGAALVLAYLALKTLFGIDGREAFVSRGFFERAVVTQTLFAAGMAVLWLARRFERPAAATGGLVLVAMALARLVWFDLVVFNPMLEAQDVGGWPVVNFLLLAFGPPVLFLAASHRLLPPALSRYVALSKAASLALMLVLVLFEVRQLFHGALPIKGATGTAELYAYSAAALATAIAWLVWGTARRDRMVRLASLGLMLAAVAKVFLYDAAELTGLWRIAAFAGLGVSLLAISWFYGRYVFTDRRQASGSEPTEGASDLASDPA